MQRAARDDGASRAILPKNPRVDLIDWFPQIDVSDRQVHFEHAVPIAAGGFENCMNVAECLFGLYFNRAGLLLACSGIDRQLSGNEYETVVDSRLRVMTA